MAEIYSMEPLRASGRKADGFILVTAILALAAAAKAILYDTLDPDLFWHLRVGGELARQGFPRPLVDDLSFASIRTAWTPYSWLADLAMTGLWNWGGYRAAVAALAIMTALLVIFIALHALELTIAQFGKPRYLAASVATFAGMFLSLPYLSFRPVTAALVLLAAATWLLQRDRRLGSQSQAVWLVIPITVLLINIHLYAVFVPAAVVAMLIASPTRRYAILAGATMLSCLMTPMLPGVMAAAWHYQFGDVMVRSGVIAEMQPFYHGHLGTISAIVAITVIAAALGNRRRLGLGSWLWLAGGVIVLLRLGRFSPIFGIFAAPTLAVTAPELSDAVLGRKAVQGILATVFLLASVRVVGAFPSPAVPLAVWVNRMGIDTSGYPTSAADFVETSIRPRSHRLITEFTWGGYLEWRLGNNWQVLMDGRTQVFPREFWTTLYMGTPAERKAYLATVNADAAIVPTSGSQFKQCLLDLGWKVVHTDPRALVLTPDDTARQ
jgi:hypothetical protein